MKKKIHSFLILIGFLSAVHTIGTMIHFLKGDFDLQKTHSIRLRIGGDFWSLSEYKFY